MVDDTEHLREVVRRLNKAFYETDPAEYFHSQAIQLTRLGDELAQPTSDTPPGEFAAEVLARMPGWKSGLEERGEAFSNRRRNMLTIEAFMLAHHVGEALLRSYFAHLDAGEADSPWFSMSELQGSKKFNVRVSELVKPKDRGQLRIDVAWAFLLTREQNTPRIPAELVEARLDFIVAWVRRFAEYHLESVTGYNAAKHGLSAIPGQRTVSFHPERADGAPSPGLVMLQGDVLESLEYERQEDHKSWRRTTRAVDAPGLVVMALVAAHLLSELWNVGKARHLGGGVKLRFVTSPLPTDVRAASPEAWSIFRMPIFAVPLGDSAILDRLEGPFAEGLPESENDGE
jgi:hypothetical protein